MDGNTFPLIFEESYALNGFPLPQSQLQSSFGTPAPHPAIQSSAAFTPNGAAAAAFEAATNGESSTFTWPEGVTWDGNQFHFSAPPSTNHLGGVQSGGIAAQQNMLILQQQHQHQQQNQHGQQQQHYQQQHLQLEPRRYAPLPTTTAASRASQMPSPNRTPLPHTGPYAPALSPFATPSNTFSTANSANSSAAPSPASQPYRPSAKLPVLYPDTSVPAPLTLLPPVSGSAFAHDSGSASRVESRNSCITEGSDNVTPDRKFKPRPTTRLRRSRSFDVSWNCHNTLAEVSLDSQKLDKLFDFLDESQWSLGEMLHALSEVPKDERGMDLRSVEHRQRMEAFLLRTEKPKELKSHLIRRIGPEDITALWKDSSEKLEKSLVGSYVRQIFCAVIEIHPEMQESTVDEFYQQLGESHGSAIRNIVTRDGKPYEESPADIRMLDATLSRPPTPGQLASIARDDALAAHLSQPDPAQAYTGRIVVPPTQADILSKWLMSPGRPAIKDEKDSITPEHMRIYSSLNPLELHARGAEVCRVVLTRDRELKAEYGYLVDSLESFLEGPTIAPSSRCNFHSYDDYSLWHHCLMIYLQLCTRYPTLRESGTSASASTKPFVLMLAPDLSTLAATAPNITLESRLVERALQIHWEFFRLHLLQEGGLLRRAVKAFAVAKGAVRIRPLELMLICDDTQAVLLALKKSSTQPGERILPYDPLVSEARNQWRQAAFWSPESRLLGWQAATTHFLEISALFPRFSDGVRELPALEKLLSGGTGR